MQTLSTLFEWLLTTSLRASLLTLAICVVQIVLQKHLSPRWRYALWLPVLVVLLMPVLPESRWSAPSVFEWKMPVVEAPPQPVIADAAPSTSLATLPARAIKQPAMNWQHTKIIAWATGAALLLLLGGVSFTRTLIRFRRTRQSMSDQLVASLDEATREVGLRKSPRVLVSPRIQSPAVTGLLRPVLLLPLGFDRDFTAEEKSLILQHELMHLKRGDLPLNTLLCVLMALHWFNPLLWIAFLKVRADREAACDAQVLENATPQRRSAYGHALLKIESAFAPLRLSLGFIGILQRHASLRARIRSIATPTRTRPFTGLLATACILAMTFLGVTRAEKPAKSVDSSTVAPDAPLFTLEIRTLRFNQDTDWDFGGRMKQIEPQQQQKGADSNISHLSPQELPTFLQEVKKLPGANLISLPRMVVQDGKEANFRSVINQPVPNGKKENGEYEIAYLPIGYIVNLTPKRMHDDQMSLEIDLTNSKLVGREIKDGQEYPIAHSRVYRSTVELATGMTAVHYDWEGYDWKDDQFRTHRPMLTLVTVRQLDPRDGLEKDNSDETGAEEVNDHTTDQLPTRSNVSGPKVLSEPLPDDATSTAEAQAAILRRARPQQYDFSKANLDDVLWYLATDAGIQFISVPEDHPASTRQVTFSLKDSPFGTLETICESNGLMLVLDKTTWHIRAVDESIENGKPN